MTFFYRLLDFLQYNYLTLDIFVNIKNEKE